MATQRSTLRQRLPSPVLGWAWLVYSVLIGLLTLYFGLTAATEGNGLGAQQVVLTAMQVPGAAGGWGVVRGREWGRPALIGASLLNVIVFPPGTLISGYTLWTLLRTPPRARDKRPPSEIPPQA